MNANPLASWSWVLSLGRSEMGEWWMWDRFSSMRFRSCYGLISALYGGKAHQAAAERGRASGPSSDHQRRPVQPGHLVWLTTVLWARNREPEGAGVPHRLPFIEKALAVDNVSVWLMLFGYLPFRPELHAGPLYGNWVPRCGLDGVLRAAGSSSSSTDPLPFRAFLLLTGVKMLWAAESLISRTNPLLADAPPPTDRDAGGENVWRDGVRDPLLLILALWWRRATHSRWTVSRPSSR